MKLKPLTSFILAEILLLIVAAILSIWLFHDWHQMIGPIMISTWINLVIHVNSYGRDVEAKERLEAEKDLLKIRQRLDGAMLFKYAAEPLAERPRLVGSKWDRFLIGKYINRATRKRYVAIYNIFRIDIFEAVEEGIATDNSDINWYNLKKLL